jgi:hypothetical protein
MKSDTFIKMRDLLKIRYPFLVKQWSESLDSFGEEWKLEFSQRVASMFGADQTDRWEEAITGYAEFCVDAMRAQAYFEKNGRYRASSYQECYDACYNNSDYMERRYLPGQYLSHYVWPHHQRMLRNFRDRVLPTVRETTSLFYEVGVGCGLYSLTSLECLRAVKGVGVDISKFSLNFTNRVIQNHGYGDRYDIMQHDIFDSVIDPKCDFIICQEVLEHLENPEYFVTRLFDMTKLGGYGYITAAVNAGHTDHIYLYRSPKEVEAHITAAGWKIIDIHTEENYPEKPLSFRPVIVSYFTQKQ